MRFSQRLLPSRWFSFLALLVALELLADVLAKQFAVSGNGLFALLSARLCSCKYGSPYLIGEAYHALGAWIEEHAYTITGICRKVCLRREGDLDDYLIEIQFPVEKQATEAPFSH